MYVKYSDMTKYLISILHQLRTVTLNLSGHGNSGDTPLLALRYREHLPSDISIVTLDALQALTQ